MTQEPAPGGALAVAYVANLARLRLTAEETRAFQAQLDRVVAHMAELRELDLEGVEPTAHAVDVTNVFRADETRPGLDRERALANAPEHRDGQFAVPRILE